MVDRRPDSPVGLQEAPCDRREDAPDPVLEARPTKGVAYVAGPMSGVPFWNWPAFDEAAERWRNAGWEVINPVDAERDMGWNPPPDGSVGDISELEWDRIRRQNVVDVSRSDVIALLPGWQPSEGVTTRELPVAKIVGAELYSAVTMEPLHISVLCEAARITSGDRNKYYGHPRDNHGCTAEMWQSYLSRKLGTDVELDARDVCMLNILQKVSRDANMPYRDNLVDICGYARNAELVEIADADADP